MLPGQPEHQVVDPSVSRKKFERELEQFSLHADSYRRQGCVLLRRTFPVIELALGVPHLPLWPLLFGVRLNFTNYDALPPSARLINPWTGELLRGKDVTLGLPRRVEQKVQGGAAPGLPQNIVQAWPPPDDIPFLCTRGIREYHWHPAHSGDSWWLHRGRGEGSLAAIVSLLIEHGPAMIADYGFVFGGTQQVRPNFIEQRIEVTRIGFQLKPGDNQAPHA